MLTKDNKALLKKELLIMREKLKITEENTMRKKNPSEASGELSMYDNHPADMGTELFEREKDLALNTHAESELSKVDEALLKMKSNTYGLCEVCHNPIPFERLEAVPYTSVCIEHAKLKEDAANDDISPPTNANRFEQTLDGQANDYENSFNEVAEFGTSDSPSDFINNEHPTYTDNNDHKKGVDEIVGRSLTDETEN